MKQNKLLNQITIAFLLAVSAKAGTVTLSAANYSVNVLYNLAGAGDVHTPESQKEPVDQFINAGNFVIGESLARREEAL